MTTARLADVPFFTPKEVADFFRVSRATVYRWIDEGRLRARKPKGQNNGVLRIAHDDVVAFSEQVWDD